MGRYNLLTDNQKSIMTRLYGYLGFNEVVSYDKYLELMFKNVKSTVNFEHMINHNLQHVVKSFWETNPSYRVNNYIKHFWLSEKDILKHLEVGSDIEFDPKGVIRLFVKDNFNTLFSTKV